jgi:hypothetical protein
VGSPTLGYLLNNQNGIAYSHLAVGEGDLVYWAHEDGVKDRGEDNHTYMVYFKPFKESTEEELYDKPEKELALYR